MTNERDRVFIDKSRSKEIRSIKDNGYLEFDNQKDVFLLALALGIDGYNRKNLEAGKDGFFNDRDLNKSDFALIYSIVKPELDRIEDIVDSNKVLTIAEGIADKGFSILLREMGDKGQEAFLLLMQKKLDEMYDELKEDGLL